MKHLKTPLLLLLLLSLSLTPLTEGAAQTTKKSDVVRQLENQRKKIQEEIKRISALLTETTSSSKNTLQRISLLDQQIRARKEAIATMQSEVTALNGQIDELEVKLDSLQVQFDRKQVSYIKSIRALQTHHSTEDMLMFVLSAKDFAEGMRRAEYLGQYAKWQRNQAEKLKSLRAEIETQRAELERARDKQQQLLNDKTAEQAKLQADQDAARKEVEEARRKAELEAQKAKKGSKTTRRRAATKGGYAMTEKEIKLSKNFADNRGKLPSPISGPSRVVSRFGRQKIAGMQYVELNNNGIDLQGVAGARALSVFDGVVTRIFTLEGFNNSIIIRHGNYLTVYSNLTEVFVKTGDKVSTGQALGKVYSDPDVGGATKLHFQLWKETTKLDPSQWIRR